MRRVPRVLKRTCLKFYDDQMTHHAAALTYYALMSLFPSGLLALSLLGLIGQYPGTYDAILSYLRGVVPDTTLAAIDATLREALQKKGTAATALVVATVTTLYGTTGALEAARRALNVVFEVEHGRGFFRRKAVDIGSTFVLLGLTLVTLVLMFVGGGFADDLFGYIGGGDTASEIWGTLRWPAALVVAMLLFSFVYWATPDVKHRSFRWVTPGAILGVLLWLGASYLFGEYLSSFPGVSAVYGAFTGAIILVAWIWLTNVALLFGAELDAEIEREKELADGIPMRETLVLEEKGAPEPAQPVS